MATTYNTDWTGVPMTSKTATPKEHMPVRNAGGVFNESHDQACGRQRLLQVGRGCCGETLCWQAAY